jgi:hypothetical protein
MPVLAEAGDQDCFLCRPDAQLLVDQGKHISSMAGLGPIVENYCIINSMNIRSLLPTCRPQSLLPFASF